MNKRSNRGAHVKGKDMDDIAGLPSGTITLAVSGPVNKPHAVVTIPARDRDGNIISEPSSTVLDNMETKLKGEGFESYDIQKLEPET